MANKSTIRPDKLQVSTVNRVGRWSSKVVKAATYLTVTKGFNEPSSQIAVQTNDPLSQHDQHTALISITFADKSTWSGTFDQLQKKMGIVKVD